jgi:hypothetical protein
VDSQQWDERYSAAGFVWATGPNQFVAAELAGLPPGRAIDLAAGEGRNTVWVAEERVDWILADLCDYQPEPGAYDLALIAYLQVSPKVRATVLARAAAALAPGGTAFIVAHDLTNLSEGTGGPQDPEVLYTPEAVRAELPGLRILRAERVRRTVAREDGAATAVDTLVHAVRET